MFTRRKPIFTVLLTAAVAGLLCATIPSSAAPKPPPAPKPQYWVLDLGVTYSTAMNDQSQVVCHSEQGAVVLTPSDSVFALDGFWDSVSALTILLPDRAWFIDALDLTSDQVLNSVYFGRLAIGQGGVLSGEIAGNVSRASDGASLYYFYRGFVVKPADFDDPPDGINDAPLTDLGDGGEMGDSTSIWVTDMNEFGCIVGSVRFADGTSQAFRIVPIDTDGDGVGDIWFEDLDGDGLNDLMEPLGEVGSWAAAVDDADRAYVTYSDGSGDVILPDGTSSMTDSSLDQMRINAGNSGGLAVGYYDTGKTYRSNGLTFKRSAPSLIQGRDTDGDGDPDLWYRDANGDGKNDLMVKLPVLSGYGDFCWANAVNELGTIVGIGVAWQPVMAHVHRAVVWKNQVPVNLNTLVAPSGVVLEEAIAINQDGVILCTGSDAAGIEHDCLLMPITAP